MNKTFLCSLLFLIAFIEVEGSGFGINTYGIRSMGMGGNSAMAMDASQTFSYPAAITNLENSFTGGLNVVFPRISFLSPFSGNVDMDPALSIPFHLYGTMKLKEKVSLAVAINTPFSENIQWDDDWTGRYVIISNRFKTVFIQPTVAYALGEKFSVGAGAIVAWGHSKEKRAVDVISVNNPFVLAEQKAGATGFGFNAGIYFNSNKLTIGASYRSSVKFKFEGDATFTQLSQGGSIQEGIPSDATFETEKTTPSAISGALSLRITEKLHAGINATLTNWSDSESSSYIFSGYSHLDYSYPAELLNALTFGAGAQFNYNERTWVRAGIGIEKQSVESRYLSPAHPNADNAFYSAGLSWLWKDNLTLDLGVMIKDFGSRNETANIPYNFNGEYKSTIYSAGIGINYEF